MIVLGKDHQWFHGALSTIIYFIEAPHIVNWPLHLGIIWTILGYVFLTTGLLSNFLDPHLHNGLEEKLADKHSQTNPK